MLNFIFLFSKSLASAALLAFVAGVQVSSFHHIFVSCAWLGSWFVGRDRIGARWRCTPQLEVRQGSEPQLEVRQGSEPQLEVRLAGGARRIWKCGSLEVHAAFGSAAESEPQLEVRLAGGARRIWKYDKDQSRSWKCGSLEVNAAVRYAANVFTHQSCPLIVVGFVWIHSSF
ncbi:hypothetical protein LR48_Vigan08g079600 [Vigna angularis]|uniref:Uncharacterized protein n=1 Tax=Phaseolus angularis TaxID=3914 RepID=A0A0L9V5N4_PHAAN|nr:uncharacterized protein HKW66_Vig0246160 [Vigna angularis]KOM49969.1 hypothetical protein LR48_Vigan08g079600 [Vigna angularis]